MLLTELGNNEDQLIESHKSELKGNYYYLDIILDRMNQEMVS